MPGFYKLSLEERRLVAEIGVDCRAVAPTLDEETANHMVENVVGVYGCRSASRSTSGQRHRLVPMCVEEPSVIAAASTRPR
jgi:hydroxymethylglutaryl-CoA reductase